MNARIEYFLEEPPSGYTHRDAADALVAAGLLSRDRAEAWVAENVRLQAAGGGLDGPFDPEVSARAVELLRALAPLERVRGTDAWDGAAYTRYTNALDALRLIGALSSDGARPWSQLGARAGEPPGGWAEPEPDPEIQFTAGELHEVLIGPPDRSGGLRVTSLELYGDCVIVRFHQRLPSRPADPVERRELLRHAFAVEDDAGTAYRPAPIPAPRDCPRPGVEGWPAVVTGWQPFVPGPPPGARTFTVSWHDQDFTLVAGP